MTTKDYVDAARTKKKELSLYDIFKKLTAKAFDLQTKNVTDKDICFYMKQLPIK